MKIEYICHTCLLIETGDLRISTDPCFDGATCCNQWYLFPKPVNSGKLQDIDAFFNSHGHEDHLNERTLQTLPKTAKSFCQYSFSAARRNISNALVLQMRKNASRSKNIGFRKKPPLLLSSISTRV